MQDREPDHQVYDVSIPFGFLVGYLGTITSRDDVAEQRYNEPRRALKRQSCTD